jgi:hypothetical protein
MSSPDRPETQTSTADMLARTVRRAAQLRRRRRAALAAVAAVVVVALGVSVPLVVAGGGGHTRVLRVVGGPTTVTSGPPSRAPASTSPSSAVTAPAPPSPSTSAVAPVGGGAPGGGVAPGGAGCATGQLTARLANPSGAAGSVGYDIVFVNTGTAACTLTGYPGVSYVSVGTGTIVGAPAIRDAAGPVVTVTLDPGRSAAATLIEVDSLNFPQDTCQLTPVGGVRIYPPDQTSALFVAQSGRACANPADPVLQIEAVRAAG